MENNNLDDILSAVDENTETDNNQNVNVDAVLYSFLIALQGITTVISEHTKLQSVALTDNDVSTLKSALKPFVNQIMKLVDIIIYLPLITFSIGYTLRILDEIKTKRKLKKQDDNQTEIVR